MSKPMSAPRRIARPRTLSRRRLLARMPALGGLLAAGCSRDVYVPPRVRGGLVGAADVLTMSTNRWNTTSPY